jgi:sugar phosphate isomerase/epimerase
MKRRILSIVACTLAVTLLVGVAGASESKKSAKGAPNAEAIGWKLGCQAWSFNRFTVFEAIDKTAELGLHYIELFPGQKLSPAKPEVPFDHNSPAELRTEVLAKLKSAKVKALNYGVVGLSKDEAESRKVFDFAKAMGMETIVSEPREDILPMIDKLTKEYGINVAIHNHPKPSRYWSHENVLKATKDCSKRIGACADTGHWARSGIVPLDALKALEGRIVSFHFKDLGEIGNKEAHDIPWGTGVCDVKAMLTEIHRQGVKAVFSIEYEHNWDNNLPDIAKCVKYFDDVAKELAKSE